MSVYQILELLAATPGKLEKLRILRENVGNETLKEICRLTYSPQINFWTLFDEEVEPQDGLFNLPSAVVLIRDNITTRNFTGNAAKAYIRQILSGLTAEEINVVKRMISRDLRAGFSASTINKIWPGLVPTFDFLLADTDASRINYPAFSQLKADGMRAGGYMDPVTFRLSIISRQGKPIETHGCLDEAFKKIAGRLEFSTLDGELVCVNKDGLLLPRKVSNGILNKAIKGTITKEEAQSIRFVVWDSVDPDGTVEYRDRYYWLTHACNKTQDEHDPKIYVIETEVVNSYEEALDHFRRCRRRGLEGTIVKNINGKWVPKRSKDLCKFKAEIEAEFKVTGFEYGTGKNANRIGNLFIESQCGLVKSAVGIFKDFPETVRQDWLGALPSVVTVRYNERITDKSRKDGTESLFLPRVIAVRYDKDFANTRDELIEIEKAVLHES